MKKSIAIISFIISGVTLSCSADTHNGLIIQATPVSEGTVGTDGNPLYEKIQFECDDAF